MRSCCFSQCDIGCGYIGVYRRWRRRTSLKNARWMYGRIENGKKEGNEKGGKSMAVLEKMKMIKKKEKRKRGRRTLLFIDDFLRSATHWIGAKLDKCPDQKRRLHPSTRTKTKADIKAHPSRVILVPTNYPYYYWPSLHSSIRQHLPIWYPLKDSQTSPWLWMDLFFRATDTSSLRW